MTAGDEAWDWSRLITSEFKVLFGWDGRRNLATAGRLRRWASSLVGRMALVLFRWTPSLVWRWVSQRSHFIAQRGNTWRQSERFTTDTEALFRHFGFQPGDYVGRRVLDLGAGSRLRTRFFEGAEIVALEPLADRFLDEVSWSDLGDADRVYALPAEERIPELEGSADLLVSINVLDHCYDIPAVVDNVRAYLAPEGLAFLSFDSHDQVDRMHPWVLTEEGVRELFTECGLSVERMSHGLGPIGDSYGHGEAMSFWLRRDDEAGATAGD